VPRLLKCEGIVLTVGTDPSILTAVIVLFARQTERTTDFLNESTLFSSCLRKNSTAPMPNANAIANGAVYLFRVSPMSLISAADIHETYLPSLCSP
jgi:hypothetical protein